MNNEEIYYLTSKDVAKILHMKPRYARDLLKRENVPVIKIGRQYLIPAKDFH
ncbi:MAG: helix-turn-helix domain-containing protein, partial [Promethearchaeota archaeon]